MNKHIFDGAICAALLLASAGTSARAQELHSPASAIGSTPTLATWSRRLSTELSKVVVYPRAVFGRADSSGVVAVKFNCSENGVPENVILYKSSGHRELDQATMKGVRRLTLLHPLPSGMAHHQGIVVRFLFAATENDARRRLAQMKTDAERRNAWFGRDASATASIEFVPAGG